MACDTGVKQNEGGGGGEEEREGEGEGGRERVIPDLKTQKDEIHALLNQKLKKGDTWYASHVSHVTVM